MSRGKPKPDHPVLTSKSSQVIAMVGTEDIAVFRGWLIRDLVHSGHSVVACALDRPGLAEAIAARGAEYCPISFSRTSLNPWRNFNDILALSRILRERGVDIVLSASTKANLIGPLAARMARVPLTFVMIEGLGYAFTEGRGFKRRFLRAVITQLFRFVFRACDAVFVLNDDDLEFVRKVGWVLDDSKVVKIPGTGVDLDEFSYSEPNIGPLRVLLVARLLREKGIEEYVEAARLVKQRHPDSRFQVLGRFDSNPGAIDAPQIRDWEEQGLIEYLGEARDVRPYLQACNVYCLPSYREGMPRTIMEAMAIGRAIVTTDVPGCRETVNQGINGFLVPPRDPVLLARAIERFATEKNLILDFGLASRAEVESRFDVVRVNQSIMNTMGLKATNLRKYKNF